MTNLRRSYDELVTILWSCYDFAKIGPLHGLDVLMFYTKKRMKRRH